MDIRDYNVRKVKQDRRKQYGKVVNELSNNLYYKYMDYEQKNIIDKHYETVLRDIDKYPNVAGLNYKRNVNFYDEQIK